MVKQIPYYEWSAETANDIPFVMDNDSRKHRKNSNSNIRTISGNTNSTTPKMMLRIEVRDNGAGIRPESQAKLFGKYVQIEARKLQKGTTTTVITNIIITNHTTTSKVMVLVLGCGYPDKLLK